MNQWMYVQLALYEFFDVVPFVILAAAPYRSRIKSSKMIMLFTAVLYIMGFARRILAYTFPGISVILSILWILLYLAVYYYVVRETLPKLLFVLITVLNYASVTAILYSYIGSWLFPVQLREYPYCFEASLSILSVLAFTYPPMLYWLSRKAAPLLTAQENSAIWAFLWLVPATFCVFFYYNLYATGSILTYPNSTHNLIVSLVISAGSFFVLSLVLRLVKESSLSSRLLSERHQLELLDLQYRNLSERMEGARRARHDLRQLVAVLQVYLKNGDTGRLQSYVEQMCFSLSMENPFVYCLHPALNALICYYAEQAAKQQITFNVQAELPEQVGILDTDLVVLFGNLLENAVEACGRQNGGKRFIDLKARELGGQIIIILDNSYEGKEQLRDGEFFSSKHPGYGVGLSSVKQIAGKYQGRADFIAGEGVFHVSVMVIPASGECSGKAKMGTSKDGKGRQAKKGGLCAGSSDWGRGNVDIE